MEAWREFSLLATAWLQATYPGIAEAMRFLAVAGRFEGYLILLPLIYWCVNKKYGAQLTYVLIVAITINNALKHFLRMPRPYWLDPDVGLETEATYGAPSNHVLAATVLLLLGAGWLRRGWFWLLALLLLALMALSRIYLGVHFLFDVLIAFVIGLLAIAGFLIWEQLGAARYRHRLFGQRLLIMAGIPLAGLLLYVYILAQIGPPDSTVAWTFYLDAAETQQMEEVVQMLALMFGVGIGFTFERSKVGFVVAGAWWQQLLRYALGMAGALLIWRGLGFAFDAITPEGTLWLALPLRFIRYALLGVWIAYWAPWLFVQLRLADQLPETEMGFTVAGATVPPPKERS